MKLTVQKIEKDFLGALPFWQQYFDTWVFVHNAHRGLPSSVIQKLLELERTHPSIRLTHWGFDELLLQFRLLPHDALRSLYGSPPSAATEGAPGASARTDAVLALVRSGKCTEAIAKMSEELVVARAAGDENEEVEILAGLVLLSSGGHSQDDRQRYFEQAEKKADKVTSPATRVIYLRAQAAVKERVDPAGAEAAYRAALLCCAGPEDGKSNLVKQACVVRASLVHLLCAQKRLGDAGPVLAECEGHARKYQDEEEGELLEAALVAGIHFSLEGGDEPAAIHRVTELERFASTPRMADRIGKGLVNVANQASHRKAHRAALAAAEAAVRLGQRCERASLPSLLRGALYTEAMVTMQAGNDVGALRKAEALLDLCHSPEDEVVRQAACLLISEVRRSSGDSQTAIDTARLALSPARGSPEDVGFIKLALARALDDNGQTEEALMQAKEGWSLAQPTGVPAQGAVEFLVQIADYASQLGAEGDVAEAVAALGQVPDESDKVTAEKARAIVLVSANQHFRSWFLEVLKEAEPARTAGTRKCATLADANSVVVRPLLRLWDETPEYAAACYDFWGRGNFKRMLLNARCFERSFNVAIEVRSLDDVKRAIRLWGLYADFLILLWKGPTENGLVIIPFPEDYEEPGGWGYVVSAGSLLRREGSERKRHPAMAHASVLPHEVAAFLATEGRPFVQAGRLVVVPAVNVGCVSPGHGPFEQLLAEAANAIPSICWKGCKGTPLGHVAYSPDAPFGLLADIVEGEGNQLRKLRLLLVKRSGELRPDAEPDSKARALSLEIDDALRDLEERHNAFARKKGLTKARELLTAATARFKASGGKLIGGTRDSPFAPLLVLESLGYGWRVDRLEAPKVPPRFEVQEDQVLGAWLAPPSAGWATPSSGARE